MDHQLHTDPEMAELYKKYEKKAMVKFFFKSIGFINFFLKLRNELKQAKNELKKAWSLLQMEDLKCRKRVLRRLGYCDEQDVIDTKGRVACEIDTYVFVKILFEEKNLIFSI